MLSSLDLGGGFAFAFSDGQLKRCVERNKLTSNCSLGFSIASGRWASGNDGE